MLRRVHYNADLFFYKNNYGVLSVPYKDTKIPFDTLHKMCYKREILNKPISVIKSYEKFF